MRLKKGNIEKLTGDILIYSVYKKIFNLPEFNSLLVNNIPEKYKDGTAFGIYFTTYLKNLNYRLSFFSNDNPDSIEDLIKPKPNISKISKELTGYSKSFAAPSELILLEFFEDVNEIIVPEVYNSVSNCVLKNKINLGKYIIRFDSQQKNNLPINMQNKSYGEVSAKEVGQIVTEYFDNMSQALIRGDKDKFIDTKRKLLDFSAESLNKDYILKICDLWLKSDEKQRFEIGAYVSLMMQTIKSEDYEIANNVKGRLIKIENTLNRQKHRDI